MGKIGEILSDKESVKQISEIAQMLMSQNDDESNEKSNPESDFKSEKESCNSSDGVNDSGFDFSSLMKLQGIMGAFGKNDKNTELLLALKPHLTEEKQQKIDKAIKLLRLLAVWNVVKESGMLKDYL